jgi:hypothetical protein
VERQEWLRRVASELGVAAPEDEEIELLLALAGIAAHSSERTAAPLTCWLVGRVGLELEAALALVKRLAAESES